jgi:hypothetical protein
VRHLPPLRRASIQKLIALERKQKAGLRNNKNAPGLRRSALALGGSQLNKNLPRAQKKNKYAAFTNQTCINSGD